MEISLNRKVEEANPFSILEKGDVEQLKEVIRQSRKFDEKNKKGDTLLHVAARRNNTRAIAFLICEGANIDLENRLGYTPEDIAVIHKNKEAKEMFRNVKENEKNKLIIFGVLWPILLPIAATEFTFNILEKAWDKGVEYFKKSRG
jgi:ankyrin repeat protein